MGLFDLFSNDSAEKARDLANAGAREGYGQLSDLYGQGRNALTTNFNNASNLWGGLQGSANQGSQAYADASGANGPEGLARATQNFKSSPQYGAYGFALDQGLQGLERAHTAAGNLASGNTDTDAMKFATNLAGGQFNNYLQGLSPYLNQQLLATQGGSNVATGLGTGLNNSFNNQGNAANTTQTTIGNNNAGAELNNYKVGSNIWNGLMGGLNFLSGGAGGAGGFGGLMTNAKGLFNSFGNNA